jgi:hypothetical protein
MILHVEGASIPGAPALPEFLKADVYIPPHILEEEPDCKSTIAAMVQMFLENIGVPTVKRFTGAAKKLGWSLLQVEAVPNPPHYFPYLVPPPTSNKSAHYIFRRRPYGSLPILHTDQHGHLATTSTTSSSQSTAALPAELPASQGSDIYFTSEELDATELALIDATEELADLRAQLKQAKAKEKANEIEIVRLHDEMARAFAILRKQGSRLAAAELASSRETPISTSYNTHPVTPSSSSSQRVVSSSPTKLGSHRVLHKFPSAAETSPFPKVDISKFPRPIQDVHLNSTPTKHLSLETPRSSSKTKMEKELAVVSALGPATIKFINAHGLSNIVPVLNLIVQHNPAPRWATILTGLSLDDEDYHLLVDALTTDWLSEGTRED